MSTKETIAAPTTSIPEGNVIYIGRAKPVMTYVLATLTRLNNAPTITLKARGAAISLAVDVAQITIHRFVSGAKVTDVKLGTEQLESREGGSKNVSSIEIKIANPVT